MKYLPLEADMLFTVGPVTMALHAAPASEINDAIIRLLRYLPIAIEQLAERHAANLPNPVPPDGAVPGATDDRGGSPGGEGGRTA